MIKMAEFEPADCARLLDSSAKTALHEWINPRSIAAAARQAGEKWIRVALRRCRFVRHARQPAKTKLPGAATEKPACRSRCRLPLGTSELQSARLLSLPANSEPSPCPRTDALCAAIAGRLRSVIPMQTESVPLDAVRFRLGQHVVGRSNVVVAGPSQLFHQRYAAAIVPALLGRSAAALMIHARVRFARNHARGKRQRNAQRQINVGERRRPAPIDRRGLSQRRRYRPMRIMCADILPARCNRFSNPAVYRS